MRRTVLVELLVIAVMAAATLALSLSPVWSACCKAAEPVVDIVFFPAYFLALVLMKVVHWDNTLYHFYVGIAVEFLFIRLVIRAVPGIRRRHKRMVSELEAQHQRRVPR